MLLLLHLLPVGKEVRMVEAPGVRVRWIIITIIEGNKNIKTAKEPVKPPEHRQNTSDGMV